MAKVNVVVEGNLEELNGVYLDFCKAKAEGKTRYESKANGAEAKADRLQKAIYKAKASAKAKANEAQNWRRFADAYEEDIQVVAEQIWKMPSETEFWSDIKDVCSATKAKAEEKYDALVDSLLADLAKAKELEAERAEVLRKATEPKGKRIHHNKYALRKELSVELSYRN